MSSFGDKYPAFIVGLTAFLGTLTVLGSLLTLPFLILTLILTYYSSKSLFFKALAVAALLMSYTACTYKLPVTESAEGVAKVIFTDKSDLGRAILYRGTLLTFTEGNDLIAKNIPLSVRLHKGFTLPLGKELTRENISASFSGSRAFISLQGERGIQPKTLRERLKSSVKKRIVESVDDERASAFMTGLATGDYAHKELSNELQRFALQHIMAISGFHFALIALFVTYLLKYLVPESIARPLVMCILTGYFTFLGWSPSIFRAWVMAIVFLSSALFYRKSRALNALGVAALLGLAVDPLSSLSLGFQFSFGITASILFFFTPIEKLMRKTLPVRRFDEVTEWSLLEKLLYVLLYWIRNTLALSLAVTLVSLPLTLHLFHVFPLQSIVMNFVFPLGTSVVMLFLLPGLLINPLLSLSGYLASALIDLAYNYPLSLEYWIHLESSNSFLIATYFFTLFFIGVVLTNNDRKGILLTSFKRRS